MIDTNDIEDIQLENATGYPDFTDAYISAASWSTTGKPLTENELDQLNEDTEFIYQCCLDHYF